MTWQIRSEALLGAEKINLLRGSHVAVFGLGGVGSWAAEALVRSGLGQISLIDGDTTEESNLNRQLPALRSNLGSYKTEILAARFLDINPELSLQKHSCFYRPGQADHFLQDVDLVLDCIDDLPAKVDLIASCAERGLPLLTAGGCGFRLATQGLVLADIFATSGDPLLKKLRKLLRDRGVQSAPVVYFTSPLYPRPQKAGQLTQEGQVGEACLSSQSDQSDQPLQDQDAQAGRSDLLALKGQVGPVSRHADQTDVGPASAIFAPAACGLEMARLAVLHLIGDQVLAPPQMKD